jgi:hypothetical protein
VRSETLPCKLAITSKNIISNLTITLPGIQEF